MLPEKLKQDNSATGKRKGIEDQPPFVPENKPGRREHSRNFDHMSGIRPKPIDHPVRRAHERFGSVPEGIAEFVFALTDGVVQIDCVNSHLSKGEKLV